MKTYYRCILYRDSEYDNGHDNVIDRSELIHDEDAYSHCELKGKAMLEYYNDKYSDQEFYYKVEKITKLK